MIAIIYGTRPEFLKVYPVILEAKKRNRPFITINTGQHTGMLTEMEALFGFSPDYKLKCQSPQYSNANLLARLIDAVAEVVKAEKIENYFSGKLKIRLNPPFGGEPIISRLKASDFKAWVGR